MWDHDVWTDARRRAPRVDVDAVCWEDGAREAMVTDLSADGLRIERPFVRYLRDDRVQLELEMPGSDEVIWLGGEVCFDRRRGHLQTTGVRVVAAAARDLRRLRDYVHERRRGVAALYSYDLAAASCYLRG
jgi:PilZ domain